MADHMSVEEVLRLVSATARWVHKDVFRAFPVWFPEHSRGALFYKSDWSESQTNTTRDTGHTIHKSEGNTHANQALTLALGTTKQKRRNWSCCHIWGVDDAFFQKSNSIVRDPRYFSCTANMVLLPTPLKAFTDTMPRVKQALRICAYYYYGWYCDHRDLGSWKFLDDPLINLPTGYPKDWPTAACPNLTPPGVVSPNDTIWRKLENRRQRIQRDLSNAGNYYPRESVTRTLEHWNINLETPLTAAQ